MKVKAAWAAAAAVFLLAVSGCSSKPAAGPAPSSRSPAQTGSAQSRQTLQSSTSANVISLKFRSGEGKTDKDRTLASLTRVDGTTGLYLVSYSGNYTDSSGQGKQNRACKTIRLNPFGCTLISMTGNKSAPVFGRNFDNAPGAGALLTLYRPTGKYASIAFVRLSDLGLATDFQVNGLNGTQKSGLMTAPYYAVDGMNEKGLAAALAYNPPSDSTAGYQGQSVFITNLVRKILDNAGDVDEAEAVCKKSRAYDLSADTVTHHILITDAKGNSVIAEFSGGDWRFLKDSAPYQVATNFHLYQVPEATRESSCWRYQGASAKLKAMGGKGTWSDAMNILHSISQNSNSGYTIWSFSADLASRTMYVCMNRNYSTVYKISFP